MADGNPGTLLETSAVHAAARTLGLDVVTMNIQRAEEIAPAFETLKGRVDAVYICAVPLVNTNRVPIGNLALAARLPTVNGFREAVEAEALMSYGPNFPDLFRRTAEYVEKILRGGKPGDIPVEQPTKYDLVVNLKTAKALGLTIRESFLLRTDEVIE
jgi:putative ABC transport system substrate-binding protein